MKTRISRHNTQLLTRDRVQEEEPPCNCRRIPCPMPGQGMCRSKNAVYQAIVTVAPRPEVQEEVEEVHTYVGATHDFKERYYGHRSSFNLEASRTSTTLSKFVWKMKDEGRQYSIKWRIIDRGAAYRPAANSTHCELGELASPGVVDRAALTMRIKASASFRSTDIRDAISKQLASIMICNKYLNRAEKYAIFRTLYILLK